MLKLDMDGVRILMRELGKGSSNREWYSEALNRSIKHHGLRIEVAGTMGLPRCEIDTLEDLQHAEKCVKEMSGSLD
jgi:hypothetical protein